jgi:hypothetical protein
MDLFLGPFQELKVPVIILNQQISCAILYTQMIFLEKCVHYTLISCIKYSCSSQIIFPVKCVHYTKLITVHGFNFLGLVKMVN